MRDLITEMDKYRSRNHKEKEERDRENARRSHEENHAKQSAGKEDNMKDTMPGMWVWSRGCGHVYKVYDEMII